MQVQTTTKNIEASLIGDNGNPVTIATIPLAADDVVAVRVRVVGRDSLTPSDAIMYENRLVAASTGGTASTGAATVSQNVSGSLTLGGSPDLLGSGGDLILFAYWADTLTINWTVEVEMVRHL